MSKAKEMMKKMCVIGEAAVGKTSLVRRYVLDKFDDRYIATIGIKTSAKEIQVDMPNEKVFLRLQIWDILGLRSFSSVQKGAYKGSNGAFIVIDITRKGTLQTFESWLYSLYKEAGEVPVVVLGNKLDLDSGFNEGEIQKVVEDYDFPYFLTSARTGENVNAAFQKLGEMMVRSWKPKSKILPYLERFVSPQKTNEPELLPERRLSIYEVEDIIMARYCDLLEDPDFAMAIIRNQFKKANFNFMYPTVDGLRQAVDMLITAASSSIEAGRLQKEMKAYNNLIKMIDN